MTSPSSSGTLAASEHEKENEFPMGEQPSAPAPTHHNHRRGNTDAFDILETVQDLHPAHPIHWPEWKKWLIVTLYNILQTYVGMGATMYVSAEYKIIEKYGVSQQVATLGESMFIVGNAIGPAFLGPLSDWGGRKWIYVITTALYAIMNIGSAGNRNFPMLVIFQFLCGTAGSVALANVAGTTADLWGDSDGVGQAMAMFVAAANYGPSIGVPIGNLIAKNHHMGLSWVFWINVIIAGAMAIGMIFIPETLPRKVIAKAVTRSGADDEESRKLKEAKVDLWSEMYFVSTMAFKILFTEPIVICLSLYNGWAFGLIFLFLDTVFPVFAFNNGLSVIDADLTYLNIAVGVTVMFCFYPVQTWWYARDRSKNGGKGRPEARFLTLLVVIWLFPASLFWFAFTSNGHYSIWSPIVAGGVLGFVDALLLCAMLSYITDTYPHVANSAVAALLIPTYGIAAGFSHIGLVMVKNLGTTWTMACVAFLSLGLVALVYLVFFFGAKLRKLSKMAKQDSI